MTKKKGFLNLTLGVNDIKLFSSSLMAGINNQECSPMKIVSALSRLFVPYIRDEGKSFHNFDTRCLRYKTFFFITDAPGK